jgi:osmotically-inducible protein OsmY
MSPLALSGPDVGAVGVYWGRVLWTVPPRIDKGGYMRRSMRLAIGGAVAGGSVLLRPGTHANRVARERIQHLGTQIRYSAGRLRGVSYRMQGRHPDPDVPDTVLADRIRSEIGKVEKERDLPHIHVMVENHVALLHGEVPAPADVHALEQAVSAVSGVKGLKSHLHVGMIKGDTRPSEGHSPHHS